jgi:hypothetical protein
MSGEEIIQKVNEIKELIIREELNIALSYCDYLIDDIYMYKQHSL